jgi:hypothetical protein
MQILKEHLAHAQVAGNDVPLLLLLLLPPTSSSSTPTMKKSEAYLR